MQVDDRPQLAKVWLVNGPGPDAVWPLSLGGRYAAKRGEWYFPRGTASAVILRAAGGATSDRSDVASFDAAAEAAILADETSGLHSYGAAPLKGDDGDDELFDPLIEELDTDQAIGQEPESPRLRAVTRAVKAWTDQLVDRSARNNLLFFRDQRAGTLDLTNAPPRPVFDVLAGRSRSLAQLVPGDADALTDAVRRGRTIHTKAQAIYEERGIHTLHLACGLATWENPHGSAVPASPVLLAPATITPRGAAHQDFDLAVTGDLEVNPTLLNALAAEFDCHCDPDELLASAGMEGAIDTPEELELAYAWLTEKASRVPGFGVLPKTVLGNFSYAKLPMVRDLQGSIEALAAHELIAALAGDPDAQQAIRDRRADIDPSLPDQTPPADEFLVLDADSSQNFAINKVLRGQDLVVKGPPGTGKSQTISNLISALVARQKTVLFVAEKRAAIDAVLKRLDQVGLGDLVLDLHGGVSSKRQVAQSIAGALHTNATITQPDLDRDHRLLDARRRELNDWNEALHAKRDAWDISLFDAQLRLTALGTDPATSVRLRGDQLRRLTAAVLEEVREDLRNYVGRGGLQAVASSPWARAQITTREQVERARDLVDDLSTRTLDPALDRLEKANASVGLPTPAALGAWAQRLSLWAGARDTLEHFDPAIYGEPLETVPQQLAPLGAGAGARMSATLGDGVFRAAHKRAKALQRDGIKLRKGALLDAIAGAAVQQRTWIEQGGDGTPRPPQDLDELARSHAALEAQLGELAGLLGVNMVDGSRADVTQRLRDLRADAATLGRLPELHRLRTGLEEAGLGELLAELARRDANVEASLATFEHAWLASIVDELRLSDPRVGGFNGEQQASTVSEFQQADRQHIMTTAHRVRRLAAERALRTEDQHPEQATLIRREAAKKTRHRAVRETFTEATEVMTTIKPCWVMSPLVVSQVLPNDKPYFDVVIFDEASQVRPAEAIPAIARGRRLVVAGDERQLPPTDFFSGPSLVADDEEDPHLLSANADFESVLDALEFLVEWKMLTWHYRSQDERLIAFSNAHLYGRSLLTFPGASGPECVRHVLVPWQPSQHGGEDSSNAEVLRVVELILEHAEQRPEESLGVIAMGLKHAERVETTLRNVLRDRSDLDDFFDESRPERFFIKNLERVQGDERDAILLTVGYGKSADGRMLYRFGPLNYEGGERRLNVAVTRARRRMTLVSSFSMLDMDPERTSARGAELLRLYLAYAESSGEKLDREAEATPELNPFELDIRDSLQRAGIPLICQYGASGYRLDFVAKHPDQPGRLVLAIEADGAAYHSSQTARDRDRLRQEQLERLGWQFHRIWSQDWFDDRAGEIEKAVVAYRAAIDGATSVAATAPPSPPTTATQPERGPRPDVYAWGEIDDYSDAELQALVRWIESDTLLRSREELIAEVMSELGFTRRGSKIVGRIAAAIDRARSI
ncbi:MAG TPA: AAA domain-containing protein [Solirubrobacteraceae bacterium]